MEPVKMCRICLINANVKMYPYNIFHSYYEDFLNLTDKDNVSILPQFICYECSALLIKCFNFKKKCLRSLKLFRKYVDNSQAINDRIFEINRKVNNLQSNLQFWTQSDRVKIIEIKCEDYALEFVNTKIEHNDIMNIGQKVESPEPKSELCDDTLDHGDIFDEPIKCVESMTSVELNTFVEPLPYDGSVKIEDSQIANEIFIEPLKLAPEVSAVPKVITKMKKKRNKPLNVKESKVVKNEPKVSRRKKQNIVVDESKWKAVILTEEQAVAKFNARKNGFWYEVAPYRCDLCFKGFAAENSFKSHQSFHSSELGNRSECKFCKIKIKSVCRFKKHIKTHYEEYHCLKCPYVGTSWDNARSHEDMHYGKGYVCQTCNETFAHSSSYYSHLRVLHRSQHICGECGESFVTPKGVTMHRARAHKIYTKRKTKQREENAIREKELERKGDRYCKECDVNFTSDAAYDKHLLSSENHAMTSNILDGDSQEKPQEAFKPLKDYRPQGRHLPQVWRMRFNAALKKRDTAKSDQKRRVTLRRNRTTTKTHCKECGQLFASVKACMAHHNAEHPSKAFYPMRRVICEICGKDVQYAVFNIHMNKHTKTVKFQCEWCPKVFYVKATLKRHMLTHTGEKPHKCSMCDKSYTQQGSLKLHIRTAHHRLPYPPRARRPKPSPLDNQNQCTEQE